MSIRGVLLLALRSLKWKSFPSNESHGQHMAQGIGAPQTSLAKMAVSIPDMKRAATCTPRRFIDGSFKEVIFADILNTNFKVQTINNQNLLSANLLLKLVS